MITVLTNGRVLDCVGDEPLENASVVIEDAEIKDVYSGRRPSPEGRVIDVEGRTILPGLSDAHVHPALTRIDIHEGFTEPPIVIAMKIRDNLERILEGGYTTIRDQGAGNLALKQAVEDGIIKGPRMLICNHPICQTGGVWDWSIHGDFSGLPKDDTLVAIGRLINGPEDARKAVREQIRAGADHIKTFTSGSPGVGTLEARNQQQLSDDELRAIVDEAKAWGKYVSPHATNTLAIRRAIEAGVRAVDHGIGITEELAQMMKEKGIFFVSTIGMADTIAKHGREWGAPEIFIEGMKPGIEEAVDAARIAHKAGVAIAAATDDFGETNGYEGVTLKWLVEVGLTPYEALKSATVVNANLFRMEDSIGSIEVGKWADIIVVDGHPDEDASVLAEPTNVRLVMKKGEIFKLTL